jgi:hypothetical protein
VGWKFDPTWEDIAKDSAPDEEPMPSMRQLVKALRGELGLRARQIEALRERVRSLEATRNPEGWEEDWPSS